MINNIPVYIRYLKILFPTNIKEKIAKSVKSADIL